MDSYKRLMVLVMILDAPTGQNGNVGMGLLQAHNSKHGMVGFKIYHHAVIFLFLVAELTQTA